MKNKLPITAIVTDIEGTTSSLSFVKDVLFPYAHKHMSEFILENYDNVSDILDMVRQNENNMELTLEEVIEVLLRWIEEDQKLTPLKTLQGMIWQAGYEAGDLSGHVYEDALNGLKRWKKSGIDLYVYSSGSIAAQKLLFGNTQQGDLTSLFSGYFDTTTGPKLQPESYKKIAKAIGCPADEILFLSDNPEEIDAAVKAGLKVVVLDRDGILRRAGPHAIVGSFDDIDLIAHDII